jgi:hypothetical protein
MRTISRYFLKALFVGLSTFLMLDISAQQLSENVISPQGIFDIVKDRYGKEYHASELKMTKMHDEDATYHCQAGYFMLHFF